MKWKPYPAYKPSGVEWLGDVPEHWNPITLRHISKRYAGGTPDRSNDLYWEDGTIPWINSGAVNQSTVTEPSAFITEEGYLNSSAKWVAKNDLVMALAGQGKDQGNGCPNGDCSDLQPVDGCDLTGWVGEFTLLVLVARFAVRTYSEHGRWRTA